MAFFRVGVPHTFFSNLIQAGAGEITESPDAKESLLMNSLYWKAGNLTIG
jgi:hypothetical protein